MGKQTTFDTDIHVPLDRRRARRARGQGHASGRRERRPVPDVRATRRRHAGQPVEGRSLVPLLQPNPGTRWRTAALIEHKGGNDNPADPDFEGGGSVPTTYEAIRISANELPHFDGPVEAVYVEYADPLHEIEYYDINKDPYELNNTASRLTAQQREELHQILAEYETCHDANACWNAGRPR